MSNTCTCCPVPEKYWTTHYGAVDPATTMEPDPDCPEHFPKDPAVETLMDQLNVQPADREEFVRLLSRIGTAAAGTPTSPKQELLWRLNEQVNQRDPGKPNHWRGL